MKTSDTPTTKVEMFKEKKSGNIVIPVGDNFFLILRDNHGSWAGDVRLDVMGSSVDVWEPYTGEITLEGVDK